MDLVVSLVAETVQAFLTIVELCFLLRAILSLFSVDDDHPLLTFAAFLTEPFILPIRALFDRFDWFRDSPLDIPFMVSFLLINLISTLLMFL